MANRLYSAVTVSLVVGPIAGALAAAVFYFLRFLAGPDRPEFISPPESGGGNESKSGSELLHRAENMVLEALRSAPSDGLSNAEVGERTALNPPIKERRGEVSRSILVHLVEQGIVEKIGQRYRLAR